MKPAPIILCVCAAAALSGFTVSGVREEVNPKGKYSGLEAHETHASASLLGQFRTNISAWLWLRTDLYLHNGVSMRPLTERELDMGRVGVGSSDNQEGHLHDDSKVVTVIPSADRDFRGVFGDIERATKAYKDMTNHGHNNPKQALPLFRLMTWLDPYFTPGWTTGAAVLAMGKDPQSYAQAVEFLNQGLSHNPESVAILNQLGFTYTARLHQFDRAVTAFERARAVGNKYELTRFDDENLNSLLNAYRWLALVYRETGKINLKYEVLREGLAKFPDDVPLQRLYNAPPLVLAPQKATPPVQLEEPEEPFAH